MADNLRREPLGDRRCLQFVLSEPPPPRPNLSLGTSRTESTRRRVEDLITDRVSFITWIFFPEPILWSCPRLLSPWRQKEVQRIRTYYSQFHSRVIGPRSQQSSHFTHTLVCWNRVKYLDEVSILLLYEIFFFSRWVYDHWHSYFTLETEDWLQSRFFTLTLIHTQIYDKQPFIDFVLKLSGPLQWSTHVLPLPRSSSLFSPFLNQLLFFTFLWPTVEFSPSYGHTSLVTTIRTPT